MTEVNEHFLKTKMTQKATAELLAEKLRSFLNECTYNVKRYEVPISLVLLYCESDISDIITAQIRLTDVKNIIKINDSYFNFIFLPFTDVRHSFSLINHIEYKVAKGVKVFSSTSNIEGEIFSYYSFINTYLDEIDAKNKGDILHIK